MAANPQATDLTASNSQGFKMVNNYVEGDIVQFSGNGDPVCHNGKTPAGQMCGRWNAEIRDNVFAIPTGQDFRTVPHDTHQAFIENNIYISTSPSSIPTVELNGEDILFRQNRVEDENFTVAPTAKRVVIDDNSLVVRHLPETSR